MPELGWVGQVCVWFVIILLPVQSYSRPTLWPVMFHSIIGSKTRVPLTFSYFLGTAVKGGPRLMQFDFHQRNASAQNFTALELILPITSKNMKYRSRLLQRACVSVARVTTCSKVKGTLRFRTSDNNQEIVYDLRGILPNSQKNVFTIFVRFSKDVFPAKVIHRPVLVLSNRNPSPISLPRLQSHIYTARESRTKRELSENGGCRRVSWSVHVKDLGWLGVVVTPTTFTIGYCVGKCTLDTTSKFTNNAQIRAQYIRLLGNAKVSVPAPCCVPIQYSPVTVWYVKDGSIVQEVAPEMDVIECGCL